MAMQAPSPLPVSDLVNKIGDLIDTKHGFSQPWYSGPHRFHCYNILKSTGDPDTERLAAELWLDEAAARWCHAHSLAIYHGPTPMPAGVIYQLQCIDAYVARVEARYLEKYGTRWIPGILQVNTEPLADMPVVPKIEPLRADSPPASIPTPVPGQTYSPDYLLDRPHGSTVTPDPKKPTYNRSPVESLPPHQTSMFDGADIAGDSEPTVADEPKKQTWRDSPVPWGKKKGNKK